MTFHNAPRRVWVVLAGVGVLLAAGGGVAMATGGSGIPDGNGVIHGCYVTAASPVKPVFLTASATSCPAGYTAIAFNQTGPVGPQGPAGAAGPAGPRGATGPAGPAGVAATHAYVGGVSRFSFFSFSQPTEVEATPPLPSGTYVVTGIAEIGSPNNFSVNCFLVPFTAGDFMTDGAGTGGGEHAESVIVSDVYTVNAGQQIGLECEPGVGGTLLMESGSISAVPADVTEGAH
jgi:hypothetical protein